MKYLKKFIPSIILLFFVFIFFLNFYIPASVKAETINEVAIESEESHFETGYIEEGNNVITSGDAFPSLKLDSTKSTKRAIVDSIKGIGRKLGANPIPTSYKTEGLNIKDQKSTGECWAFTTTTVLEAYDKKQGKISQAYSPRHIDYSCSKSFSDLSDVKEPLLNRETSEDVGNFILAMAYLSRGKGPVLEKDYPFVNDCSTKVSFSSLDKPTEELVKEFRIFQPIYKKYNGNTVKYYDNEDINNATEFSSSDVTEFRNSIKEYILENGAVGSMVYQVNTNTNMFNGGDCASNDPNHAITIIGWDDNYQANSWPTKGAYVCQNSYGTELFDNGIMYVSYDDKFIERGIFGISDTEINEIDNIYEYDEWGSTSFLASASLTNDTVHAYDNKEITAVNIFVRDNDEAELLNKVGITTWSIQKAEIYVTEKFKTDGEPYNFKKVGEIGTMDYGAHIIDLTNPVTLTNNKYAVAVRFIEDNSEDVATAPVETFSANSTDWWYGTKGNRGESYYVDRFDPNSSENTFWELYQPNSTTEFANAGIKAYTINIGQVDPPVPPSQEPEDILISDTYTIDGKNRRITRVLPQTTCVDFFDNIVTNVDKYPEYSEVEPYIVDKDKKPIIDYDEIVKTGFMVIIGETEYEIAVRGDTNCDGVCNLFDVIRLRRHWVGFSDSILTGIRYYAADMNGTGKVEFNDLTQMRWKLVE